MLKLLLLDSYSQPVVVYDTKFLTRLQAIESAAESTRYGTIEHPQITRDRKDYNADPVCKRQQSWTTTGHRGLNPRFQADKGRSFFLGGGRRTSVVTLWSHPPP